MLGRGERGVHMGSTQQSYVKFLNSNRVNFNVISVKMVEFMTVQLDRSRQPQDTSCRHQL